MPSTPRLLGSVRVALAAALLLVGGCAGNGEEGPLDTEEEAVDVVTYDVAVQGDMPDALRAFLLSASGTERLTARPPAGELILRRRAEADIDTLQKALRSEGYYAGQVAFRIEGDTAPRPRPDAITALAEPARAHVLFDVEPGPLYRISRVDIVAESPDEAFEVPTPADIGLAVGDPAGAQRVLDAETRLLGQTMRQARPLARLGPRRAVIDNDTKLMEVTFRVTPGPRADVGTITFAGDSGIDETFLHRRLPFSTGDPFDPDQIDKGRNSLVQTNLFSIVRVEVGTGLDADGRIPVTYDVTPRLHRSVGGGVGYQTDTGAEVHAYWENRNLFSAGERLRAEATLGQTDQELDVSFRKPDILVPRLALLANTNASSKHTDAYDSDSLSAGTGLEYGFTERVTGTLGVAYRYADIKEEDGDEETYGLVSFPATIDWDFSDNLLDPSTGGRIKLFGAPYFDTLGTGTRFYKTQLTHSRYLPLLDERRLVLALRGSLGAMDGASRGDIPADERFYSGGGGSVRGIGYQLAGPLDDDDNPLGGRSLAEFSIELRSRFTESIGAVAFLDGGSVFDNAAPDFDDPLRLGTGAGLRYITPIGPLRFDVGVPVDRRRGVDDAYQVYISIGQAF
ncbi:MAG TPA: autotransporter assembly complex family protein [Geminicoccaceae bacterium]|nr:autotransporter assembly complex family protein [Geminicoccus sp.]HMU48898.1 autotransporter assembly complex family protein [Geminicoccaceae bacterium]